MTATDAPIALTLGEPSGIGPEIAVKAWEALGASCPFFVIGDPRHLEGPVARISDPSEAVAACRTALPVLARDFGGPRVHGSPQPAQAQAVVDAIAEGVALVMAGKARALTTGPIHKKALKDGAGFAFPGHTEFLAHLAGVDQVVMMLACDELRVVPTTIHIPLSQVPKALTPELLRATIEITHEALKRDFGIADPTIAVAGLNPHAGEGGAMGHEELDFIGPIVQGYHDIQVQIFGPVSADTLFTPAMRARYDAAICMYHDQALIPIKTINFDGGVNVTLGLPFVRTSPDHGTALEIAGRDLANPTSLISALRMAHELST